MDRSFMNLMVLLGGMGLLFAFASQFGMNIWYADMEAGVERMVHDEMREVGMAPPPKLAELRAIEKASAPPDWTPLLFAMAGGGLFLSFGVLGTGLIVMTSKGEEEEEEEVYREPMVSRQDSRLTDH